MSYKDDLIFKASKLLREADNLIAELRILPDIDQRKVSIANTEIEKGFVYLEHAIKTSPKPSEGNNV